LKFELKVGNIKNMFYERSFVMKKLLVLALVLAVAGLANAALVLQASSSLVNPGDVVTMTIVATGGDLVQSFTIGAIRDGGKGGFVTTGTVNASFVTKDPGWRGSVWDDSVFTDGDIVGIMGTVDIPNYASGTLYTYTYKVSNSAIAGTVINFTFPDVTGDVWATKATLLN